MPVFLVKPARTFRKASFSAPPQRDRTVTELADAPAFASGRAPAVVASVAATDSMIASVTTESFERFTSNLLGKAGRLRPESRL